LRSRLLRRTLYAVAIAAVVTALAAAGLTNGTFAGFQRRSTDSLFPSAKTSDDVVVVALDDTSIETFGRLPWPRSVHADLARALADAGVRAAVWDVLFSRDDDPAVDADLAAAFGELPAVVLAAQVRVEPDPDDPQIMTITAVESAPNARFTDVPTVGTGHVQTVQDPSDGVIRSLPVVVKGPVDDVPSLSLAALQAGGNGTSPVTVRRDPQGVNAEGRFIPTEGRQLLRLNFADGLDAIDDDAVISAVDVIEGRVDQERLRGKTVFVGATAASALDDKQVPVQKSGGLPGVMVHANALNTMLTSSYLSPVSDTQTVLWVALVALAVALAVLFFPVWLSVLATLLISAAYLVTGLLRFDAGDVMNFVYPFGAVLLTFMAALGVKYVTETRQRRRVSSLFAQYVPEAVAKQLEESGHLEEHIDGERVDVGLFFCDLRGFTSLSSTLEPPQVRAMLNHFYELVTQAILEQGGTVLKFVGDEVFAVFGAPLPVPDHVQRSLDCAMEIQRRAPRLDRELESLHIPAVKFGIGMNAGEVVAAHVGGGKRRQYDVVGDTVNLGSRLCGQAGKGEIVIPESMIERLSDPPPMEPMGAVALKGLEVPVHLFKIVVAPESDEPDAPEPEAPDPAFSAR
jgi:adenylate cyclase